jgi:hypothetical protein
LQAKEEQSKYDEPGFKNIENPKNRDRTDLGSSHRCSVGAVSCPYGHRVGIPSLASAVPHGHLPAPLAVAARAAATYGSDHLASAVLHGHLPAPLAVAAAAAATYGSDHLRQTKKEPREFPSPQGEGGKTAGTKAAFSWGHAPRVPRGSWEGFSPRSPAGPSAPRARGLRRLPGRLVRGNLPLAGVALAVVAHLKGLSRERTGPSNSPNTFAASRKALSAPQETRRMGPRRGGS